MTISKRSRSRQFALQAIYQWQMTGQDVILILDQFLEDERLAKADVDFFMDLIQGIPTNLNTLDQELQSLIDRPLEQVDAVERAALRIGSYELIKHAATPYRVIINEAVELAKIFGADQGHRYVNGVLDRLARRIRSQEVDMAAKKPQ
ncbi:hypothetical protein TI04_04565 [Achromatium sp. WMS2]|nr:hypothetical protein TI04_04565 [Achromatium sp. WMS2]